MSIGNLKDSGNQGNNFPYQLAVLRGLNISQMRNLQEIKFEDSDSELVRQAIDIYFGSFPNRYLVSKTVVSDGTKYTAFLTVATL